jgi:hypothetical protein
MSSRTGDRRDQLVSDLDFLLRRMWAEHPSEPVHSSMTLRSLGITSSQQVSFLSEVERVYGLDWEELELAEGALSSLGGIADVILNGLPSAARGRRPVTPTH